MDEWYADLKKMAALIQNPEFMSAIDNPKLPFKFKAKLIEETFGKVRPLTLNFGYLLIMKGKFKDVGSIAAEFYHLVNEYRGVKLAEVITAVPMDDVDKKNVARYLETMTGSKIEAQFKVVPSVLGGIIARVDGSLIDGSVLTKLEMLKKSMAGISK